MACLSPLQPRKFAACPIKDQVNNAVKNGVGGKKKPLCWASSLLTQLKEVGPPDIS